MASAPIAYDAEVTQQSAHRLYRQVASIVRSSATLGSLIGVVGGLVAAAAIQNPGAAAVSALVGGVLGGVVGYARGQENAFKLKLQAQVAPVSGEDRAKYEWVRSGVVARPPPSSPAWSPCKRRPITRDRALVGCRPQRFEELAHRHRPAAHGGAIVATSTSSG
jgi:hypothetical protein